MIDGAEQWQRMEAKLNQAREELDNDEEYANTLSLDVFFSLNTTTRADYPHISEERIVYDDENILANCPMRGLYSALVQHNADCLLLAVDLFLLSAETLVRLLKEYISNVGRENSQAVYFRDERIQPLCAIYKKTLLPELKRAVDAQEYSLSRFLENVCSHEIEVREDVDTRSLMNMNRKEDLYSFMSLN